ncbi:MAG: excisionase family DNA-binding protein [Phycisphaerales bacterium]
MKRQPQSFTSRQFAKALGVSESSVKRWVDDGSIAAARTAGGHRRIPLAAAIGFIRSQRATVAKPNLLSLEATPQVGNVDEAAAQQLHDALVHDRVADARAIIAGRYLGGADVASIADNLIRPVLHQLGELWLHGPEGILLEHRAMDTCVHALTEIGSWIPALPESAPSAVTAGGPGDPYLLPPMLASLVLRECGIRTRNLGPCTPLETVGIAMSRYGARLSSISIGAAPEPRAEAAWLALARSVEQMDGRIVVGGRCSGALPAKVRERVRLCASMSELAGYGTGWLEGVRGSRRTRERRS